MTIQDLSEFIKTINQKIKDKFGAYEDREKAILSSTVKLSEEVGELSEQILKHNNRQRTEKGDFDKLELGYELADVILAVLMLANDTDINIEEALQKKMIKINERFSEKEK